jgi:prepilin-type N-terminal cleavage/methylation domain-containing protein
MTIRSHPREWGYTLIEMMVTVAIVGVVSAITLTSFRPYFQEQKLRLAAGELENQLTTGRTIATKNSGN